MSLVPLIDMFWRSIFELTVENRAEFGGKSFSFSLLLVSVQTKTFPLNFAQFSIVNSKIERWQFDFRTTGTFNRQWKEMWLCVCEGF
jgi:hypothetical protein